MDDARTRLPESHAVFFRGGTEEVEHFLVLMVGDVEIAGRAFLCDDEVIAMHGGRHGDFYFARLHELENGHLRGGVLHGHAIRAQQDERLAALQRLLIGIVQMRPENLFCQRQRMAQRFAGVKVGFFEGGVEGFDIDLH